MFGIISQRKKCFQCLIFYHYLQNFSSGKYMVNTFITLRSKIFVAIFTVLVRPLPKGVLGFEGRRTKNYWSSFFWCAVAFHNRQTFYLPVFPWNTLIEKDAIVKGCVLFKKWNVRCSFFVINILVPLHWSWPVLHYTGAYSGHPAGQVTPVTSCYSRSCENC